MKKGNSDAKYFRKAMWKRLYTRGFQNTAVYSLVTGVYRTVWFFCFCFFFLKEKARRELRSWQD
jgi:hypothetical protein